MKKVLNQVGRIFRQQPALSDKDKDRLRKAGYLDGWNKLVRTLKDEKPSEDDLKRLVLIEIGNGQPRRQILEKLIVQIQKSERREIRQNIKKALGKNGE